MQQRSFKRWLTRVVGLLMLTGVSVTAHAEIYMLVPNIPGDSTGAYTGWISVSSFSGNFTERSCGDVIPTKGIDIASAQLAFATITGSVFSEIIIAVVSPTLDDEVLRIRLREAKIVSLNIVGGGADPELLAENLHIEPTSIEFESYIYDDEGLRIDTIQTGFSCARGRNT